ncbi:MAG: alpha/beta hydrolase fold domain-containing protein, partial [Spirochaetota bacterium]
MPAATEEELTLARHLRETRTGSGHFPAAYIRNMELVDREKKTIETAEGTTSFYILKAKDRGKPAPVHIYLHGGGFVIEHGDRDLYFCSRLAAETHGIVVDIDYKLAPEYKYPSAFNEAYAVTKWVFENIENLCGDAERITINGYSAGGNLAAAVAIKATETHDFKLRMLLLNY